jgi:F0F1-type ATP synthase membrane subunit c/vacuolar-type H+-ATPase subunit K
MRKLGFLTTGVAIGIVVASIVLGVKSTPDAKRYMRMRSM